GEGVVGGGVVEGQQFVGVPAGVHRRTDPFDLGDHVVLLVVAGKHDRDAGGGGPGTRGGLTHGAFRIPGPPHGRGMTAIHMSPLNRHAPAGGFIRVLGSWSVCTSNGCVGSTPGGRYGSSTSARSAASTASRPRAWTSPMMRCTVSGAGGFTYAVGTPHIPRTSCMNLLAVLGSTMSTLAGAGISAQVCRVAAIDPTSIR